MATIKNVPIGKPEKLADLIKIKKNQVLSKSFASSGHVNITLLSFSGQEDVSEEKYFGDTMYYIIEGNTYLSQNKELIALEAGDVVSVPADVLHGIGGKDSFKVLQITVNED